MYLDLIPEHILGNEPLPIPYPPVLLVSLSDLTTSVLVVQRLANAAFKDTEQRRPFSEGAVQFHVAFSDACERERCCSKVDLLAVTDVSVLPSLCPHVLYVILSHLWGLVNDID
jgi:hypothetical protein